MDSSELTMAEVLATLSAEGYSASFTLSEGVRCPNDCTGPVTFDATWRFEGVSDPDDEGIILALRCATCGVRGVLTDAYGAVLNGAEGDALASLQPTPTSPAS